MAKPENRAAIVNRCKITKSRWATSSWSHNTGIAEIYLTIFENRERSCEYTERCKLLVLMFVRCIAMTWIAFCRVWIVCMSTTFRRLDAIKQKNTCNKCESSCNVCEAKKNPIAKFCKVLVRAQLVRANCERGLNDTYPLNRFCSIHPCHHLNMKKQQ